MKTATASGTFARGDQVFRSGVGANDPGGVFLSVREVDLGDYALVRLLAIRPGPTVWTCMPEGAPVFALRPGEITVVRTDQWWWDFQAPACRTRATPPTTPSSPRSRPS